MTTYPGDLTPAEQDAAHERFKQLARERWGDERAAAINDALRRVAIAVGRMERLQFSHSDAPGFYLHETAAPEERQRL